MASSTPTILVSTPRLVAGYVRDFYVESIHGPFDLEVLRLSCETQIMAAKQSTYRRVAALSIFHDGVTLPDAPTRNAADETIALVSPYTKASVMSLLAKGFTASILRSLFVGANFVSRTPFPTAVVSSVRDGCEYLLAHVEPPATLQELINIAESTMASHLHTRSG